MGSKLLHHTYNLNTLDLIDIFQDKKLENLYHAPPTKPKENLQKQILFFMIPNPLQPSHWPNYRLFCAHVP